MNPFYTGNNLYALATAVGSGKTRAAIEYLTSPENRTANFIYVAPTIKLVTQTAENLKCKNSARNINLIHSENTHGVKESALTFLNITQGNIGATSIITTKTFISILARVQNKGNWKVILDEAFSPLEFLTWELGRDNPDSSRELFYSAFQVIEVENNKLAPQVGKTPLIHSIVARDWATTGQQYQPFHKYAECVTNLALQNEFVGEDKGKMVIASYVTPEYFAEFQEVVLLSALFKQSILYYLWSSLNIEFKEHKFFNKNSVDDIHRIQGKHISIGYILQEKDKASRHNLQKNSTTFKPSENTIGDRVVDKAISTSAEFFKGKDALITVNEWVKPIELPVNLKKIPVMSHGINEYKDYLNIAVLAVTNPEAYQINWLERRLKHLGLTKDDLYRAYRIHTIYQAVGRTAIRTKDDTQPKTIIVISAEDAKFLHELFVGSTYLGQIGDIPILKAVNLKRKQRAKKSPQEAREVNKLRQAVTRGKATDTQIQRLAELRAR